MDVLQWSRHYRCFPGQGALDVAGFVDARARRRLRRPALARGLQRRLPPGRPVPHGGRRHALADRARGRAAPAARAARRVRVRGARRRRRLAPRPRRCCARWASRTPARTAPSRCSCGSTATSASCSTTASERPGGRRDRRASSSDPDASAARAEALLAPRVERRRGAGRGRPDGGRGARRHRGVLLRHGLAQRLPPDRRVRRRRRADRAHRPHHARPAVRGLRRGRALLPLACSTCSRARASELAAPDGLVRSRAFASGDVRVVLNVPALAGTRDRAELQHVAFACADALATARAMRERGVPLLAVPEQLLRRPGGAAGASTPRRCARARRALRPHARAASSCTSTRPASAGACSSRCSSAAAATRGYGAAELTRPHGRAARGRNPSVGGETCRTCWSAEPVDHAGRFGRGERRRSASCRTRRRCAGCSARA